MGGCDEVGWVGWGAVVEASPKEDGELISADVIGCCSGMVVDGCAISVGGSGSDHD